MFYRPAFATLALLLGGCTAVRQPAISQRYAVLRFENLTPDRANDWIGRAASEVLAQELSAIPSASLAKAGLPFSGRVLNAPGVSTEITDARLAGATRLITGYYDMLGGKLTLTATEEDATTGKLVRAAAAQGTLLASLHAIATLLSPSAKPFSTASEPALRDFALGKDAGASPRHFFEEAIAADPKFAAPYLAWSERALAEGDRPALQEVLDTARQHNLPPVYMAKLELNSATLAKDGAAREKALLQIVNTDPADASALRALADSEMLSHHFQSAASHYARMPSAHSPEILNALAYARMYGGDEQGALAAIQEYRKSAPQDPNAIDSEGDIQLYFGHFENAEKSYLRSAAMAPNSDGGTETWKAARARLMTGDVPGASQVFKRFLQVRQAAKDPLAPLYAAQWQYLSGGRNAAIDALHRAADAAANPAVKLLILAQASIWELQLGRKNDAVRDSESVIRVGPSQSAAAAALVRFSAFGTNDLSSRAELSFHGPGSEQLGQLAVAYAWWFARQYSQAAVAWKRIYEEGNPSEQGPQFLYAGASKESGGDASALLKSNPIPLLTSNPSFESLYFPQLFEWRGDHQTFLKLSGSTAASAK